MEQANETVGTGIPLMEYFIGTKEIIARPMNRLDYNKYRGWDLPSDEDGTDQGYLVEYIEGGTANDKRHKGYISWSPKLVFKNSYSQNGKLTFGDAIIALKKGKRVQRKGWNGKGLFIFQQVISFVPAEIVPKMTSLPQSVKDEFIRRFEANPDCFNNAGIMYRNQIAMVYPDNNIYGWVASPSDVLENDWIVLD